MASDANPSRPPRLLLVGPLPPPPTGTGVTFEAFRAELSRLLPEGALEVIDTSPKQLKRHFRAASTSSLGRALGIASRFRRAVWRADRVLVFGSNGFLLTMAPILLLLARRARRPLYLRAFGGSLDRYLEGLNPLLRCLLLWTLRGADGLSVQTALLYGHFRPLLGDRVSQAPGFRPMPASGAEPRDLAPRDHRPLRLIFVGLVFEDKGIFVLLDSLRRLSADGLATVHCDIYGAIYSFVADRFQAELARTPNATYRGVLPPATVVATMTGYDALVLPTYYQGEGHPGVLIEAMMAGIPVVTTRHRSIPELVDDRRNGLLIPPRDPAALADALRTLDHDRSLLAAMARESWQCRTRYDARRVAPVLARQMTALALP